MGVNYDSLRNDNVASFLYVLQRVSGVVAFVPPRKCYPLRRRGEKSLVSQSLTAPQSALPRVSDRYEGLAHGG